MIPIDYTKIYNNRILIITGVGRSGTSIVGKIIGSLYPAYYLYEPAILKYCSTVQHNALFGTLFEDYFLNHIQGRINENPNDQSYGYHYYLKEDIDFARIFLKRRSDAIRYINATQSLFVIKMPEYQPYMSHKHTFKIKYIHVIRNGFDVIASALRQGWFTDDWCKNQVIESNVYTRSTRPVPMPYSFAVPRNITMYTAYDQWNTYTPLTRAACAWRWLTQCGMNFERTSPGTCATIQYNQLFDNHPFENTIMPALNKIGLASGLHSTDLTEQHLRAVKIHTKQYENNISLESIEQPERNEFERLMIELKYL